MKVLQVIGNMWSGGAEKLLLETLPIYKAKEIKVDLLLFDGSEYPFLKELKKMDCCIIHTLNIKHIYNPIIIFKLIPYLRQYDIVHAHLVPAQYWVVFSKIISFSRVKLVQTEHNYTNSRMKSFWFKYIDIFIYKQYDKMVCLTDEMFKIFSNYTKINKKKYVIINNGINLNKIYNAKAYKKNELLSSISENDKIITQVSRFNKQKDQKTVIKSLMHLPENIKLIFVGEGETMAECEMLVSDLHLQKRVFFLGVRNDVSKILKTSDIIVLSSYYEGLSLSCIEGLASGKPFIGANVDGMSNIIKDCGLLFESKNDDELGKLILRLLTDNNFYKKIVSQCLETAKMYDINTMVQKHIEMYKSLHKEK